MLRVFSITHLMFKPKGRLKPYIQRPTSTQFERQHQHQHVTSLHDAALFSQSESKLCTIAVDLHVPCSRTTSTPTNKYPTSICPGNTKDVQTTLKKTIDNYMSPIILSTLILPVRTISCLQRYQYPALCLAV